MISIPEMLYYAECEGLTNVCSTDTSKLNHIVNKIRNWEGKLPSWMIEDWAEELGLYLNDADWDFILNSIE